MPCVPRYRLSRPKALSAATRPGEWYLSPLTGHEIGRLDGVPAGTPPTMTSFIPGTPYEGGTGQAAAPAFHGIRARTRPMPQVSVRPEKVSPAPTNPASPRNAG